VEKGEKVAPHSFEAISSIYQEDAKKERFSRGREGPYSRMSLLPSLERPAQREGGKTKKGRPTLCRAFHSTWNAGGG